MTPEADRVAVIRLSAQQLQRSELLAGLEQWLQLGLLSQTQVRQFCQIYLTCVLPERVDEANLAVPAKRAARIAPELVTASPSTGFSSTDFAPPDFAPPDFASPVSAETHRPSWLAQSLQALMAEIGVIWLLCLGVFMVVVSSGVLAASQWRNFSPVGQYSILLAYTLAFWIAGLWTGQKPTLQLTARMLQMATLLIVPVNFWMMDGLHLWQSGIGIAVNGLAALLLVGITLALLTRLSRADHRVLVAINILGLSALHWGWAIAGFPLVATYIGTIGTALLTYVRLQNQSQHPSAEDRSPSLSQLSLTTLIVAFATLLLLGRAILAAQIPLFQLGLAFGICGWLFCWLTRPTTTTPETARFTNLTNLWTGVGIGLLLLGWTITVTTEPPIQAFAISGLALWLLGDRLWRFGGVTTLVSFLLIGLQAYGLLWRLLPLSVRQSILETANQLLGSDGMPFVLLSLAGFPYLWLMLGIGRGLRQQSRLAQSSHLARITDLLALALGSILTLISLANPIVRSINLALAALTLAVAVKRRSLAIGWFYLCHLLILAAIFSWIDVAFPKFSQLNWAQILLAAMAIEWGLSVGNGRQWRQSCWHLGLGLASLSYLLLFSQAGFTESGSTLGQQSLLWLVAPALLTGLSRLRQFHQPRLAAWLSAGSLLAQLFLLNAIEYWVIALAIAASLMVINTLTLQHFIAALLTLGFALGFEATTFYHFYSTALTFDWVMLLLAANLWLLWLGQNWLLQQGNLQQNSLAQLYAAAANFWAIVICGVSLIGLSLYSLMSYAFAGGWFGSWIISAKLVLSSGMIAAAVGYYLWRRGGTDLSFLGLAWAVELFAATLIGWQLKSIDALAIVTLTLGLGSQIAGDFGSSRWQRGYLSSWHLIPLLYAGLGVWLGHHHFTTTTGLYTLAAALVGIGVGRRATHLKPLTLIALLLGSIAAYELLTYQLMQATGENAGDGITLWAGLAAGIAIAARLGQVWLLPYLRLQRQEFVWFAHLHWVLGSGFALFAVFLSLSQIGLLIWFLVAAGLAVYALVSGREPEFASSASADSVGSDSTSSNDVTHWTYAGILEAWGVLGYALYQVIPETLLLAWAGAIAAIVAVGQYFLPWRAWGWVQRPWCNMAMLLPGLVVVLTTAQITLQSLLVVAAFYAWIAKTERQPRLSYLSIFLFDWAAWQFLASEGWLSLAWISVLVTGSLLYIAQVDPALQTNAAKEQRHWLRLLAVGLLSLTLLYQAEIELEPTALWLRLLTLVLAIGLIFLGLVLRVRAFLYVGTATFMLGVLRLLWLFINNYSLLLWAIGIVIGLIFIWIAATFEARRYQMNALMQYWLTELASWE